MAEPPVSLASGASSDPSTPAQAYTPSLIPYTTPEYYTSLKHFQVCSDRPSVLHS